MSSTLTYKPFGAKAILIEWPAVIEEDTLQEILRYKAEIEQAVVVQDCIVGYHSLLVVYGFDIIGFEKKVTFLKEVYSQMEVYELPQGTYWNIPVCYDPVFGVDLALMSTELKLSIEQIVALHSQAVYTVFFIGFLPGFLYLGGLDDRLAMPRRATPRLRVPRGAVAIGGNHTGVYPSESAGGWNIIGRSPISFFDAAKQHPCFAKPGDRIGFEPVSLEVFTAIEAQVAADNYHVKKIE